MEVTKRVKGLDLIDRVLEELWTEVHDTAQDTGSKTVPKKKKCRKAKPLSDGVLQTPVKEEKQKAKERRKAIPV